MIKNSFQPSKKFPGVNFLDSFQVTRLMIVVFVVIILNSNLTQARPEYAIRYNNNRCTACHFSPAGGGSRNLQGKLFGAHGFETKNWLQKQDVFGLDMKVLYQRASDSTRARGGMGVMQGTVWGSFAIQQMEDGKSEMRVVAEQNMGGFGAGTRQWYFRWKFAEDTQTSLLPQYILIGRFIPPFGLMSDEHRVYTRLQSGTTWNTGFDTGILFSANPFDSLHYDIAALNGQKNAGTALAPEMADIFGVIGNLRWMPLFAPIVFGASQSYYPTTTTTTQSLASSLYFQFSFGRLTHDKIPATVSLETVRAENWNNNFTASFVSSAAYATSVATSESEGYSGGIEWDLTSKLVAQYRYDWLALNRSYPKDRYDRHGFGFKHFFANNSWGIVRYEKANAGHPAEAGGEKVGAQDAFWILLNGSI